VIEDTTECWKEKWKGGRQEKREGGREGRKVQTPRQADPAVERPGQLLLRLQCH
jgi:hypothetical protein